MSVSLHFDTDFYRRDAVDEVVAAFAGRVGITTATGVGGIRIELVGSGPEESSAAEALRAELTNAVLEATVHRMRGQHAPSAARDPGVREADEPASADALAALVAPHVPGSLIGLGWSVESIGPVREGALGLVLRHETDQRARVAVYRNAGAPVGVAHTDDLDFFVMNGGAGTARTDLGIARVLVAMARRIHDAKAAPGREAWLAALTTHQERGAAAKRRVAAVGDASPDPRVRTASRVAASIERGEAPARGRVLFEFAEAGTSRLVLYDALLELTASASVMLRRLRPGHIELELRPRGSVDLSALAEAGTQALALALAGAADDAGDPSAPTRLDAPAIDALVATLAASDPLTLGLGFVPAPGPGHDQLRVLNLRGTGACDSDCVFCVEKFDPTHGAVANADATRRIIARAAGQFDVVFFASGEPTIHPKLFEYVAFAREAGFRSFGMSSHFRSFADPAFARRTLEAGFQYFDISLHAADPVSQLEVNPIGDEGRSLAEALQGLAVLYRLAEALGIRITVTHKIVVSRLNAHDLANIVEATYRRGVRSFILQPVRTNELSTLRRSKLDLTEDAMIAPLNELLAWAATLPGAVVKPYGFSRQALFAGAHVETERNRVKNVYGRARHTGPRRELPPSNETRPRDGRHWIELMTVGENRHGFAADGASPVLDGALERGLDLSFGCRMGACGMCAARLLEGEVDQSSQVFLSEQQIAEGYVLLCQACPRSDVVLRVCGEDEIDTL